MLVDTSVLLRTLQIHHPQHEVAVRALEILPELGRDLHIVAQNLIELWAVATRPLQQNGLGMAASAVEVELKRLKRIFRFLPETAEIYPTWESLVTRYRVVGKPAHDARLVAAMQVHGLSAVLTFDRAGFSRYAEIEVVHPQDVKA